MSLPPPNRPTPRPLPLSSDHLQVLGSIATTLGHLDLAVLSTVRDLVPGADRASVEALLAGDTTRQLTAKFDRLVKQTHGDEAVVAKAVSWSASVGELCERWEQEFRSSWSADRPDDDLERVKYTRTTYSGGLVVERTSLDDLRRILVTAEDLLDELSALAPALGLGQEESG